MNVFNWKSGYMYSIYVSRWKSKMLSVSPMTAYPLHGKGVGELLDLVTSFSARSSLRQSNFSTKNRITVVQADVAHAWRWRKYAKTEVQPLLYVSTFTGDVDAVFKCWLLREIFMWIEDRNICELPQHYELAMLLSLWRTGNFIIFFFLWEVRPTLIRNWDDE